jgi:signal transduction histidine kinase
MQAGHPWRVIWLLATVTFVPMAMLAWLGVRTLAADRDAERLRQTEALALSGERIALDLDRQLRDIEDRLTAGAGVRLAAEGPISTPALPLLYAAAAASSATSGPVAFPAADSAEFQRHDLQAAADAYRGFAKSVDAPIRAAALLGLGRVRRKAGDTAGALAAYTELQALGEVQAAGQPAALVARLARLRLLKEGDDPLRLRREATEFAHALHAGSWPIDRTTFDEYSDAITRAGGPAPPSGALARTAAALQMWEESRANQLPPRGRRLLRVQGHAVLALWRGGPDQSVVWLATLEDLHRSWQPILARYPLRVAAETADGDHLFGPAAVEGRVLMPAETGLPFVLRVAPVAASGADRGWSRAVILLSVLGIAFSLMMAAGYGIARVTYRELSLARHQTDFVSAVSHEFRTPLTSMRHLLDLLATRDVDVDRRAHYYGLLARETERLHRMVERLLAFGQVEAGAHAWAFDEVDVPELVDGVLAEFRQESRNDGRPMDVSIAPGAEQIVGEREALARALWNLIENAAKYSEPGTPIRVEAARVGADIHLRVHDQGIGITEDDRRRIFHKFQRGASVSQSGIRGVGIGLALVRLIAEGHGGSVVVESQPGRGSTFTLVLPAQAKER